MQSKKLAGAKPKVSTQRFLDIAEIRDDTVLMKDGTMRAALLVSSINFSLKSEEEQNAIISAYVGFLNFLDFPLQIVIQSRRLDIDDYLRRLEEAEKGQGNELLRAQVADYRSFVKELVQLGQIMAKRFLVVIPYNPLTNKRKSFWGRMKELFAAPTVIRLKEEKFQERKKDLTTRVEHVQSQLAGIGLQCTLLDTQALIELYYSAYNPDMAQVQKLSEIGKLQVEA